MPETYLLEMNYKGSEEGNNENIKIKRTNWKSGCQLSKSTIFSTRKFTEPIELKTYQYIEEEDKKKNISNELNKPCTELEEILG